MFGFTIHIGLTKPHFFSLENQEKINYKNYNFWYKKFDKFSSDKLFIENDDFIIGLDGVILNLQALKNTYAISDYFMLIAHLYSKQKINFLNLLKGEFSGFIFDKKNDVLHAFNNKTATKKVFYTKNEHFLMISTNIKNIIIAKENHHLKSSLNIKSCYNMLTLGNMIENETLVNDIYKLGAGEYVTINKNKWILNNYHSFNNIAYSITNKKEALNKINDTFLSALKLEYQKDIAYNYKHLATLSGGLDSRMNVMLATEMGYKNDTFCFSQTGYLDEKIARKIASDLQLDFKFIPLDGGEYLNSLEEIIEINSGLQFFFGAAHYNFSLKKLDLSPYGLIHTGQIGDGILGGFVTKNKYIESKQISTTLKNKALIDTKITTKYTNEEVFKLYQRVFNLTNFGSYTVEHHQTYLVSPFMDDDFIKVGLSIYPDLKYKQGIYLDWIRKFHNNTTKYQWERTGFKPNKNWKTALSRYTKKIKKEFYKYSNQSEKLSMTPTDFWYNNNATIQEQYHLYFKENIKLINNNELFSDMSLLFFKGNTTEKSMVFSILEMVRKFNLTT